MACPFLKGTVLFSCGAMREVYIPSRFEFEEYCTCAKYEFFRLCAAYRATSVRAEEDASAGLLVARART